MSLAQFSMPGAWEWLVIIVIFGLPALIAVGAFLWLVMRRNEKKDE